MDDFYDADHILNILLLQFIKEHDLPIEIDARSNPYPFFKLTCESMWVASVWVRDETEWGVEFLSWPSGNTGPGPIPTGSYMINITDPDLDGQAQRLLDHLNNQAQNFKI